MEIHKTRKRVCNPLVVLDRLLANGHSTDLPATLTELMGILVNGEQVLNLLFAQNLYEERIGLMEYGTATD
ncbi:MAG: hypothetical protein MRJ67_03325 [Nitrospirales bacterium]|nr:hypothetical protein [Nitrospira sp.]MDR4459540.1 hypothetical protein [Nitrospirales bacterium]MDR4484331.1 hypothetical protein [Nitrospirales bacterium]MDR4484646.1 hypothetical protein [Nitrospirales bacterium]